MGAVLGLALLCAAFAAPSSGVAVPDAPGAKQELLRSFAPPKKVNYREPQRIYIRTNAAGWRVHLESELVETHSELGTHALRRLAEKLEVVTTLLPGSSHARLRQLPIFVLLGEEAKAGGRDNGGEYFQKHAPEHWDWTDPRWGSSLVIYSARNLMFLTDEWVVRLLIHELAHAWHLEQWPEEQPEITLAWKQAKAGGLYQNVKAINGSTLASGYALANQLEYFAELSCAYFWTSEYAPFNREQLKKYDAPGYAMLERMWGVDDQVTKKAE